MSENVGEGRMENMAYVHDLIASQGWARGFAAPEWQQRMGVLRGANPSFAGATAQMSGAKRD